MSPQHSMHLPTDMSPDSPRPINIKQASTPSSCFSSCPPAMIKLPLGWNQQESSSLSAPRLSVPHGLRLTDSPLPALRLSSQLPDKVAASSRDKGTSPVLSLGSSITSPSRYTHARSHSSPGKAMSHPNAIPRIAPSGHAIGPSMAYRATPPTLPRLNTSPPPPPALNPNDRWTPSATPPTKRILLFDYPTPITRLLATEPAPSAPEVFAPAMQPPQGLKNQHETRNGSPPSQQWQVEIKAEPQDSLARHKMRRPGSTYRPPARPRLLIHPYACPAVAEPDARKYHSAGPIPPRPKTHTTTGSQMTSAQAGPQAPSTLQRLLSPSSTISSAGGLHRPGPRKRADDVQLAVLNTVFDRTAYPSTEERDDLARRLGITSRSVQIWVSQILQGMNWAKDQFQNRRRSAKVEAQSSVQRAENEALAAHASCYRGE